jgi:hypothetical protein
VTPPGDDAAEGQLTPEHGHPAGAVPQPDGGGGHAGHEMAQPPGGAAAAGAANAGHGAPAGPTGQAAQPHAGHVMPPTGTTEAPAGQAEHAGHATAAPTPPPEEPRALAAAPGQPAATLSADPLDAPAATSVAEARRAAALAIEMAGQGHGGHGGTYRHLDAGRGPESAPEADDPHAVHPEPPGDVR